MCDWRGENLLQQRREGGGGAQSTHRQLIRAPLTFNRETPFPMLIRGHQISMFRLAGTTPETSDWSNLRHPISERSHQGLASIMNHITALYLVLSSKVNVPTSLKPQPRCHVLYVLFPTKYKPCSLYSMSYKVNHTIEEINNKLIARQGSSPTVRGWDLGGHSAIYPTSKLRSF